MRRGMSERESERQVEEGERKFLSPKLGECSVCAEAPLMVTEMADGSRTDPVQDVKRDAVGVAMCQGAVGGAVQDAAPHAAGAVRDALGNSASLQQQGAVDGTRNVVASVAQETQIRKLIEMNAHKDPLWRTALTEWMCDVKQYTERIDKKEKRLETTINEIYQVVAILIAFQGWLFGAALPKGQLRCSDRWFILLLSAFASSVAFCAAWHKRRLLTELEYFIAVEDPPRQRLVSRVDHLRLKGTEFDFKEYFPLHEPDQNKGPVLGKKSWAANLFSYGNGVLLCIFILGVLCGVAMNNVLCSSEVPSPSPSPSRSV